MTFAGEGFPQRSIWTSIAALPAMVPDLFNVLRSDAAFEKTSQVGTGARLYRVYWQSK